MQLTSQQELPPLDYGAPPYTYETPPSGSDVYSSNKYINPKQQIVTKNIYVHLPPPLETEEIIQPEQKFEPTIPKKHYKILFIKTPNFPEQQPLKIPSSAQDEHKTLVYVLVKKPETALQVQLSPPTATEATKPEVFFIKYKNNEPLNKYGPP